jgi:hypothetical protein
MRKGEKQEEQDQKRREAEGAVSGKERSRRSSIRKGEKQEKQYQEMREAGGAVSGKKETGGEVSGKEGSRRCRASGK